MTFEAMFEKAKASLSQATVADAGLFVAIQVNVTGDGEGIFYVKAAGGALEIEPYDYMDNDAVLTADGTALLAALAQAKTNTLTNYTGNPEKIAAFQAILATIPAEKAPKKTTRRTTKSTTTTTTTKTTTKKTTTKAAATKSATTKTAAATKTAAKSTTTKKTATKAAAKAEDSAVVATAKATKATAEEKPATKTTTTKTTKTTKK